MVGYEDDIMIIHMKNDYQGERRKKMENMRLQKVIRKIMELELEILESVWKSIVEI